MSDQPADDPRFHFVIEIDRGDWDGRILDRSQPCSFGSDQGGPFLECDESDAEFICAALNAADAREKASDL